MFKKGFIVILFTLFLTACGQGVDSNDQDDPVNNSDISTSEHNGTTVTAENDHSTNKNANTMNDNNDVDASNENTETNDTSNDESNEDNGTSASVTSLKVHYMDVGQADATLFQFDGHTILYDTGDWNRNDVIHYLDAQEVTDIDLVVISHPHADHIGQLEDVMDSYNIGEVWVNGAVSSSQTFINAMAAVDASDADYEEPRAGDHTQIGPMDIDVLHPATNSGDDDLNRDSLSLRFSYGDVSFVFTGDAYKEDERMMMSNVATVQADILQLGHHGSKTSSDPKFIEAVNPDVAIYSAGSDNSYGHPSPETVSLIQDAGITLYGTDVHGTIIVTSDGESYDIQTKEDGTITPSSTGKTTDSDNNNASKEKKSESDTSATNGDCISINDASIEELQEIIHIGPVRAEDVIDARPFDAVSDLTKVKGIGPARIDDIQEQGLACTGG